MNLDGLSRREFGLAAGAAIATAGLAAGATALTPRQIVERIQKNIGVEWDARTVDVFKAGNPDTAATGIAVSFMATFDVLQRAAAKKLNFVITHEPTFYNHPDRTDGLKDDPIYQAKQEFIAKHDLVVWRFHDHWHKRSPDPVQVGIMEDLGWTKYQLPGDRGVYVEVPKTTLGELAAYMARKLGIVALRAIGDPKSVVSRIAIVPGAAGFAPELEALPKADVYVCGEAAEWEGVEYARDTIAAGKPKGMILLGHVPSEEPGMRVCTDWLKGLVKEIPVEWVPAHEAFWVPSK